MSPSTTPVLARHRGISFHAHVRACRVRRPRCLPRRRSRQRTSGQRPWTDVHIPDPAQASNTRSATHNRPTGDRPTDEIAVCPDYTGTPVLTPSSLTLSEIRHPQCRQNHYAVCVPTAVHHSPAPINVHNAPTACRSTDVSPQRRHEYVTAIKRAAAMATIGPGASCPDEHAQCSHSVRTADHRMT